MTVPKAPSAGFKEVHVSVKRSRDYQAVEVSATYELQPGTDAGVALSVIEEVYALLAEDAETRISLLAGQQAAPQPQPSGIDKIRQMMDAPAPSDDDAPPFYDNEAWEAKKPDVRETVGEFLMAKKPDKAKGPKEFRYLSVKDMSKRELEDASKALAAERGFPADEVIAFDNRDRLDKPGWGACVVKARRGSSLADKLGDRDTVGYTAWNAEGKLVLDVWAKV